MEEKARIFRVCVWLRPIHPPKAADETAIVVSRVGLRELVVRSRMVRGGNFIIVDSRRAVTSEEPCRTSGNQKWNGTRPNFVEIAIVISVEDSGLVSCVMSH